MHRDPLQRRARASVLAVLTCYVALGFGLAACSSTDVARPAASDTGSPTASSPSPSSTAVAVTDAAVAAATDAVRSYYATTDELLSDPQAPLDGATRVASGDELDLLRRQVQEQRIKGLRQTGAVTLMSLTATRANLQAPATVTIDACVDVSTVDVLDASGASVLAAGRPSASVVHLTVVESGDLGWTVDQTTARGEPCAS